MNKEQSENYMLDIIKNNKNVLELGKKIYSSQFLHITNIIDNDIHYDLVIINDDTKGCGCAFVDIYNKIKDKCNIIIINGECNKVRNAINISGLWTLVFEVRGTVFISQFVNNRVINEAL
jgi:hypothetical protein